MTHIYETLRRIQLFEFCESSWCPAFFRESIVDALGESLRRGKFYEPICRIFAGFCKDNGYTSVLDLGSGSGEPIAIFMDHLLKQDVQPPKFSISDLLPNIHSMERVAKKHPEYVSVIKDSVDATNIPDTIDHQVQTIISTFHHFDPQAALRIISGCVEKRKGFFIVEPFPRNSKFVTPVLLHSIIPVLLNPFKTKKHTMKKALFTYLFPLIPAFGIWDGLISSLRMYSQKDLMELVKPFNDYEWKYYALPISFFSTVTVFTGAPKKQE